MRIMTKILAGGAGVAALAAATPAAAQYFLRLAALLAASRYHLFRLSEKHSFSAHRAAEPISRRQLDLRTQARRLLSNRLRSSRSVA